MDIVKRAYLSCIHERGKLSPSVQAFHNSVIQEIKRLIQVRGYESQDWPRELGPLPEELRSKHGRKLNERKELKQP